MGHRIRGIDPFGKATPGNTGRGYVIASDLRDAGYPEASPGMEGHRNWPEMHRWCRERFGDRYTWAGSSFFFTNDRDRVLFKLRWS